ncbi:hypothetical protein WJX72_006156 [[Myrmecia] bisecta]|uniref:Periodic tryptophan protein 1 n=1 Tax=[Myrmecia] bisecta TaxID=41462 RepID=A0AAW1QFB1_9CHLO
MISALCWLPRGAAKPVPEPEEPSPEELAELRRLAEEEQDGEPAPPDGLEESEEDSTDEEMDEQEAVAKAKAVAAALKAESRSSGAAVQSSAGDLDAAMAELDMDHYDDESDGEGRAGRIFGSGNPGMAYYRDNDQDPYITLGDQAAGRHEDSEEDEDFALKPTDFLILTARNEDDVSHLEVWVYEEADAQGDTNLYVHHDVLLPAFPLSLAWMDCDPSGRRETANLAAVGTMSPGIEIWDLDVLDAVEPLAVLGGEASEPAPESTDAEGAVTKSKAKKLKKKKKSKPLKDGSHTDAVLGLAWNQASVLLTGAFDKNVCMVDMRTPASSPLQWELSADVEALTWVPHDPTCFLAASEDGIVACFDARKGGGSGALYRLAAHDKPTCSLSFCPAVPGLLATGSTDKQVKLWDVSSQQPNLIATEDLKVGAVFSASFCPEAPCYVAAGGAKGTVAVWDILTSGPVAAKYGRTLARTRGPVRATQAAEE